MRCVTDITTGQNFIKINVQDVHWHTPNVAKVRLALASFRRAKSPKKREVERQKLILEMQNYIHAIQTKTRI